MTEDEMVGWHHRLDGHEFEQALGDSEGPGSLACCSPWGCNELDMTQQLNNNKHSWRQRAKKQFTFEVKKSSGRVTLLAS